MIVELNDKEKEYLEIKPIKGHSIELKKPLLNWIKKSQKNGEHVPPSFVKLKSEVIYPFFWGWKSKRVHNFKIYKKLWKMDKVPLPHFVRSVLK